MRRWRLSRATLHVLHGMLLHVIKTPRPGDLPMHRADRQGCLQQVPHHAIVRDDIGDGNAVEQTGVARLSAAGGIERAGAERHGRLTVDRGQVAHRGLEVAQVGIVPIETCCQVIHKTVLYPEARENSRESLRSDMLVPQQSYADRV